MHKLHKINKKKALYLEKMGKKLSQTPHKSRYLNGSEHVKDTQLRAWSCGETLVRHHHMPADGATEKGRAH